MTTLDDLEAAVAAFLCGGAFRPLWHVTMQLTDVIDGQAVSSDAMRWYEEVYDLVYMGGDDEVATADRAVGLLGPAELRVALLETLAKRPSVWSAAQKDPSLNAS